MKHFTISLLLVFFIGFNAHAQVKVKERNLRGQWKMVFDFDETFIEEEIDAEDIPWLGKIVASSLSGFVFDILEEIDIQFEFQRNNKLKVMIQVFGVDEVEYAFWHISANGALILDDDDHNDDVWLFEGDRLFAYEKREGRLKKQPIYLLRVD